MTSSIPPLQIPPVHAYFAPLKPSNKIVLSSQEAAAFKILPSVPLVRLTDRNDCSAWAEVYYFETGKNWEQLYAEARDRIQVIVRAYHRWKIELWRRLREKALEEQRKMGEEVKEEEEVEKEEEMTNEEIEEEEFRRLEPERKALDQKFGEKWKRKDDEEQRKLKEEGKVTVKQEVKEEQR